MTWASDRPRLWIAAALATAVLATTPIASAQPTAAHKETARALVISGREKRKRGDPSGALADFKGAWALVKNPTTGFELGKQQAETGQLVEARDTLLEIPRIPVEKGEPAPFSRARSDAKHLADEIAPWIPSLRVAVIGTLEAEPVIVEVDGSKIDAALLAQPIKLNPGAHVLVVRQGTTEKRADVTLAQSELREIQIDLDRKKVTPTPSDERDIHWLTWVGAGAGGVGILVGGITGLVALSKSSDVAAGCPDKKCLPEQHDTLDSAYGFATVSTIGFGVGLAGAAAAAVGWFVLSPPKSATPRPDGRDTAIRPWVGPGIAGIAGSLP